jgi:hypothetical protein
MKTNKNNVKEIIAKVLSDLLRTLTYVLLALHAMNIAFEIEINPNFPIKEYGLLLGAIVSAVLSVLLKLWLLRNK